MSRIPCNPRGRVWKQSENNVLRVWAEHGFTIKQMVAMSEEWFGETIPDASIRNHLNYLGISYSHERRRSSTTPEMREWMRTHYHIQIGELTDMFNDVFNGEFTMRQVYKLAYRVGADEQERAQSTDKFQEDWNRVKRRISPNGQIAPKHWLWRYYPLDINRKASGVTFRGKK